MRPVYSFLTHNYASPALKTAYVTDIHTESRANPFQHIHSDRFVSGHLPIGGFAGPGQADDVAGTVSTSFQEEPEP